MNNKLELLAEEAKKYKSAEKFIEDINKSIESHGKLFSITAQEKRRMATGSSELKKALTSEEKRLENVYDTFYRTLKPDTKTYTDFYNKAQTTKPTPREVKPTIKKEEAPLIKEAKKYKGADEWVSKTHSKFVAHTDTMTTDERKLADAFYKIKDKEAFYNQVIRQLGNQ